MGSGIPPQLKGKRNLGFFILFYVFSFFPPKKVLIISIFLRLSTCPSAAGVGLESLAPLFTRERGR